MKKLFRDKKAWETLNDLLTEELMELHDLNNIMGSERYQNMNNLEKEGLNCRIANAHAKCSALFALKSRLIERCGY